MPRREPVDGALQRGNTAQYPPGNRIAEGYRGIKTVIVTVMTIIPGEKTWFSGRHPFPLIRGQTGPAYPNAGTIPGQSESGVLFPRTVK